MGKAKTAGEEPPKKPRAKRGEGTAKAKAKSRAPTDADVAAVWAAVSGGRTRVQAADLLQAAHRQGLKSLSLEEAQAMLSQFTEEKALCRETLAGVLAATNARVPL